MKVFSAVLCLCSVLFLSLIYGFSVVEPDGFSEIKGQHENDLGIGVILSATYIMVFLGLRAVQTIQRI